MTQLADAPVAAEPLRRRDFRAVADHVAGLGAPALALSYLVHGTGGREVRPMVVTAVASAVAALVLGAWRLPRTMLVLAVWLAAAGYGVALAHPPHDLAGHIYRWPAVGGYAIAALQLLVVSAYLRGRGRPASVALILAGATCLQFAWAFVPWWGGGTGGGVMIGTVYWHNQYAAFLYPGTVVGFAVALRNRRPWRILGWLAVPLGLAGIVYSTSRAELALAVASCAAVAVFALLRGPRRLASAVRSAVLVAAAVGVVLAMANPPLVHASHSPFATEQARTTGQSLGQNGGYRLDFWHQALTVGTHHPVLGAGYGELAAAAIRLGDVARHGAASPLAHDGYLQAYADGGLVLALPLLLGCLGLAALAVRRLPHLWRRRDVVGVAAVVAFGGVLAHSVVDFDWSYPAVFAVGAITAAVAAARPPDGGDDPER